MEAIQHNTKQPMDQRRNRKIARENLNKNTVTQNSWDAAETVLKGKVIATQAYLRKKGNSQINNLT